MAKLVQNLLNAKRVDADGHVHRVNDESKNLDHLRRQKRLGLRHRHTKVCAHLKPQLHLLQSGFVCVAASEEIVNVGHESAQQGCPSSHGHVEDRPADKVDEVEW
jgi:hypothetical protein